MTRALVLALVFPFLALFLSPGTARGHELPQQVAIRMALAIGDDAVELMLRAPLEAMRDVDFPLTPEGFLVIDEAGPYLEDAAGLWLVDNLRLVRGDRELVPEQTEIRVSLPGDRAFASVAAAQRHFRAAPLPSDTRIFWRQAALDLRLRYALEAPLKAGDLTLDAALRHLGETTRVEIHVAGASRKEQALLFDGEVTGLPLVPSPWQIVGQFIRDGFLHILGGIDHLLFLLCLVLPLREPWPVIKAITAFTVAHSITLAAASLGWIPTPLWFSSAVEAVIALSIVFLAIENILRSGFRLRWVSAFAFGLVHGFGFASALGDSLQFAQGQLPIALASFNVGVELGQLAVLCVALPLIALSFRWIREERLAMIVISTLVAHTAWHWMGERFDTLTPYVLR